MYEFLSDEWMEAARELRGKYEEHLPEPAAVVRINQVITDVPFGDGVIHVYIDTSDGSTELELGQLDEPDATLFVDYVTAKSMIVDQDPTAVMQAMMAGKITIQGDLTKLMLMQASVSAPDSEVAGRLGDELRAITLAIEEEDADDAVVSDDAEATDDEG
jgi:hypothetical protein